MPDGMRGRAPDGMRTGRRGRARSALAASLMAVAASVLGVVGASAQDLGSPVTVVPQTPIVTLDQDRLFAGTRYGQAVQRAWEAEQQALMEENRRIERDLEAEERDLTARRPELQAEEFRRLADAFDAKVEALRKAQEAKSRALSRRRDEGRQTFFSAALPILGDLMREVGAVAIVSKDAIILSFDRIDITDRAIARVDAVLGDGPALQPADQTDPAPGADGAAPRSGDSPAP